MKKFTILLAPLALALSPASVLAQSEDESAEMAEMMEMFGGMFAVEPLSADEQSRLPAATALVDKIVPAGTMGELMGAMFDGMLGPIMDMAMADPSAGLAEQLGLESWQVDLDEVQAAEAAAILDPAWQQRREREAEVFPGIMNAVMVAMEPTVKSVMSELYAINFDTQELTDIDAFFSTTSGANYARKSFTMSADPRMAGAMMQAMPAMLGAMADMETQMEEATADLPPARRFADLRPADRDRLAALLGMSADELKLAMMATEEY